jgi:hypothetical protein
VTAARRRPRERKRPVVDDPFHHDRRGDLPDAGQRRQLLVAYLGVIVQATGDDTEQVVGDAEQPLRVTHLRHRGEPLFEGDDRAGVSPVHGDVCQHLQAEPDRGGVHDGAVPGNDPAALELPQPPVAGRDAEVHAFRELGYREPPVPLKLSNNLLVDRIHTCIFFHNPLPYANN